VRLAIRDGAVVIDRDAVLPGRGAYVCDAQCALSGTTAAALARAFRRSVTVPPDFVESEFRG
jgi:predicted RNA-binding protein YlxR (DUF448 family)